MARPPWPREVHRAFWRRVAAGSSTEQAARAVGVSRPVAYRWFAASGGVMPARQVRECPPRSSRSHGRRLTAHDREEIAHLRRLGRSVSQISEAIGFHKATVSRELRRNTSGGRYRGSTAQTAADTRARRVKPAKLAVNGRLRAEVERRLGHNESPEQIANRLPLDFPDDPEMRVSHETIYTSIYVQGRGALRRDLAGHLRTGRAMRKPRAQARARREAQGGGSPLRNVISISERPAEVEDRAVPGHWEGDLILGVGNTSAIGTLVERATGFLCLLHLPGDHTALTMQTAICEQMSALPETLRRTLTWDRGSEMTNHAQIAEATGLDIYFADPASPWQRGSNENTNGLLRQYFPKGTDLSLWGPGYLEQVALEMNNRPRKRLTWHTPAEALDQLLSEHDNPPGVALTG